MQFKKMLAPILVFAALVFGLAPAAFGQFAKTQSPFRPSQRELGFYDRATGAFSPLQPPTEDAVEPLATTTVAGQYVFTINLTVKSTIPKNAVIGCNVSLSVGDAVTGLFYGEDGSAIATGSGTAWTCKVTINFSWILGTPTTADMVTMSYDATMIEGYQATATNGTGTIVEGVVVRSTSHSLASAKLPTTNPTTVTVAAEL